MMFKQNGEIYLSIVIPGLNQGQQLAKTLAEVERLVAEFDFPTEVIYVDSGSMDDTHKVVDRFRSERNFRSLNTRDRGPGLFSCGKGAAVQTGMLNAAGRFRMYLDSDSSAPFAEIAKLLPFLDQGYDLVLGSRYVAEPTAATSVPAACAKSLREVTELILTGQTSGNRSRKQQPWLRQFMSRGGNLAFAMLLGITVADSRCGFKAYSAKAAETIFPRLRVPGFGFEEETLIIARNHGFSLIEVPIDWFDNNESSTVHPLRDSFKSFIEIVQIERCRLLGRYNARYSPRDD